MNRKLPIYACFYAEDMQFMAAHSLRYGTIENGGSLFGTKTHGDNFIVMLVSGPGPNAVRGRAHFEDDPDYIMKVSEYLFEKYGLQYIGNFHSHPKLGLPSPSPVDFDQIRRLAIRNNYPQLIQLILTYEYKSDCPESLCHPKERPYTEVMSKGSSACNISPCELTGNRNDIQRPFIRIRVLKGKNPIRNSLSNTGLIKSLDSSESMFFPLDRIIFDEFSVLPDGQIGPQVPAVLADKLTVLPEDVLTKADVAITDDFLTIKLPLGNSYILTVIFAIEDACPIKTILINSNFEDKSKDITHQIVKAVFSDDLLGVYERAMEVVNGGERDVGPNGCYEWRT